MLIHSTVSGFSIESFIDLLNWSRFEYLWSIKPRRNQGDQIRKTGRSCATTKPACAIPENNESIGAETSYASSQFAADDALSGFLRGVSDNASDATTRSYWRCALSFAL